MKNLSSTLAVLLVLAAPLVSRAQSDNSNEIPTSLTGVFTIAAPPEGFDVVTASDTELASYGFPPRPNQTSSPDAYKSWVKAMLASKTRIFPELEQTNISHGPARLKKASESGEANSSTSYNWSGYAAESNTSSYGSSSFYYVETEVVVPVARQAFGECTGNWAYASSWVGMDGYLTADVLQAGVEFDAYCKGSKKTTLYSPWFEWYPANEVRIKNLPIAPGDDFFVEVWQTSATQGHAYLVNQTANVTVMVSFKAPAGTSFIGSSAEWVMERPDVKGVTSILTNYTADPFWAAVAYTEAYAQDFYPASSTAITMIDHNGNAISYPTAVGNSAFILTDTGSAR